MQFNNWLILDMIDNQWHQPCLIVPIPFLPQYPGNDPDPGGNVRADGLFDHHGQLRHLRSQRAPQRLKEAAAHLRHQRALLLGCELLLRHGKTIMIWWLSACVSQSRWMKPAIRLQAVTSHPVSSHRPCIWSRWRWLSSWSQPSRFPPSQIGRIWAPWLFSLCSLGELSLVMTWQRWQGC